MTIDTVKEREKLEKLFDDIETQFVTPRKVNLENHLGNLGGSLQRHLVALTVIDTQAAEIEKLRATIGALEGAVNWLDALLELVEETSCDPENPEEFDEVMAGAALFEKRARAALSEHEP